jgi:hypothetical protein
VPDYGLTGVLQTVFATSEPSNPSVKTPAVTPLGTPLMVFAGPLDDQTGTTGVMKREPPRSDREVFASDAEGSCTKGALVGLWLLSFTQREVAVIVEAETLAHARLLASANKICRASLFDEGFAIKPAIRTRIPGDFIGRALSQDETTDLLSTLTICSANEAVSDQIETVAA